MHGMVYRRAIWPSWRCSSLHLPIDCTTAYPHFPCCILLYFPICYHTFAIHSTTMQYRDIFATALLLSAGNAAPLIARQENGTAVSATSSGGAPGPTGLTADGSQPQVAQDSFSDQQVAGGSSSSTGTVSSASANEFVAAPSAIGAASGSTSAFVSTSTGSGTASGATGSGGVVSDQEDDESTIVEASQPQQANSFAADPSSTAETIIPSPSVSGAANGASGSTGTQVQDASSQSVSSGSGQVNNQLAAEPPSASEGGIQPSSVSVTAHRARVLSKSPATMDPVEATQP